MVLCECGCGQPTLRKALHGVRRGPFNRFLHGHQVGRGAGHMNWVGGKSTAHRGGYVQLTAGTGEPKLEHVAIVEAVLGHALPKRAQVHHVDGNEANNDRFNLVACEDQSYHQLLHRRQRALDACGDANAHRCCRCGGYERQDEITVQTTRPNRAYHRSCNAKYARERRARLIGAGDSQ